MRMVQRMHCFRRAPSAHGVRQGHTATNDKEPRINLPVPTYSSGPEGGNKAGMNCALLI